MNRYQEDSGRKVEDGMGLAGLVGETRDEREIERLTKLVKKLEADAARYRKIRGINKFVGMLEFAVAHVGSDEEYDAAIDRLPVTR